MNDTPQVSRLVRNRLVDLGAEIVCEPQRLIVRDTNPGSLEMTCRDPDGMLINLIERPPQAFQTSASS